MVPGELEAIMWGGTVTGHAQAGAGHRGSHLQAGPGSREILEIGKAF